MRGLPVRARRCVFTLVELLVVMAITGVLVALLLPAVQASREASRRTQCQNQLKQLSFAFHQHHDSLQFFPSGGWDWMTAPTFVNGMPATGRAQQAGWGYQILPGSSHPSAVNMALSDGSVRTIAYTVDAPAFNLLGQLDDGLTVSTDGL